MSTLGSSSRIAVRCHPRVLFHSHLMGHAWRFSSGSFLKRPEFFHVFSFEAKVNQKASLSKLQIRVVVQNTLRAAALRHGLTVTTIERHFWGENGVLEDREDIMTLGKQKRSKTIEFDFSSCRDHIFCDSFFGSEPSLKYALDVKHRLANKKNALILFPGAPRLDPCKSITGKFRGLEGHQSEDE